MKCSKCIFAKDLDLESCKCINPHSDWEGSVLFTKYDGCNQGKASTVGIDLFQRKALMEFETK